MILDLQEQLQTFLTEVCEKLGLEPVPTLIINNNIRGGAKRYKDSTGVHTEIKIPCGVETHGVGFMKYYIVHECTHLASNNSKHDDEFKQQEKQNLKDIYNIGIKYSRSFPKYLYDTNTKQVLWGRSDKDLGLGPCIKFPKRNRR